MPEDTGDNENQEGETQENIVANDALSKSARRGRQEREPPEDEETGFIRLSDRVSDDSGQSEGDSGDDS